MSYVRPRSCSIKYLGVFIDESLSWKNYIQGLVSRIRKLTIIFKQLSSSASLGVLKMKITYQYIKTNALSRERVQRCVLQVMLSKSLRFPTEDLYQSCKVLTVRQ